MKKFTRICVVAIVTLVVMLSTRVEIEASTPRYEQPRFSSIEELIEWIETADAANFQSGRFENSLLYWRNRGEIFIPYFSNPGITLVRIGVVPIYARGVVDRMVIRFVHSTPVGLYQIIVRVGEIDHEHFATYEARGIGYYYTASRRGEFEVSRVSEKTIIARDLQTGELVERHISYALIDELDAEPLHRTAFTLFIMDGFELGLTYSNPLVAEYFDNLVWDTAPITYRPPPPSMPHGTRVVRFTIGDTAYTINGRPRTSDVAPFIDPVYDRAMIPLRSISEALGAMFVQRFYFLTKCDKHDT